jgi:hypothetical protein
MRAKFNPKQRARQKEASRERDARAVASGLKTARQVSAENGAFSFPRKRMRIVAFR